jgi:prepilin-type N-terminal cleavage/methylation domain-containing protein
MKKGLTLLEMIITLVLLAILTSFAFYNTAKDLEKNKAQEAEANLGYIHNGQKRYRLTHRAYYTCAPDCTKEAINENLSLEIPTAYFTYSIEPSGASTSGFKAIATRKEGICQKQTISITDENTVPLKTCASW